MFESLAALTKLTSLELTDSDSEPCDTRTPCVLCSSVAHMPRLAALVLQYRCRLHLADLISALATASTLTRLSIEHATFNDEGTERPLTKLRALCSLTLADCPLNTVDVQQMVPQLPQLLLTRLCLSGSILRGLAAASPRGDIFCGLAELRGLLLADCKLTRDDMVALAPGLGKLARLTGLDLSSNSLAHVAAAALKTHLQPVRSLRKLNLVHQDAASLSEHDCRKQDRFRVALGPHLCALAGLAAPVLGQRLEHVAI